MENRIKLNVLGISFNPVHNDAFVLLLAEENGTMRIPIIIGTPEAQSIALRMENVIPPRPMTHDLFCSFAQAFGVRLVEVFIYQFEDGIFSSEMTFSDGKNHVTLDARTSDAVSLAIRLGAPIYTTREIIEQTGIEMNDENNNDSDVNTTNSSQTSTHTEPKVENLAIDELQTMLEQLIADEDYEQAAYISELIKIKKQLNKPRRENDERDNIF